MPSVNEGRTPPFWIDLAAWAVDIGAQLYAQFGDDVDLHVGSLHYPIGGTCVRFPSVTTAVLATEPPPVVDPQEIVVSLPDELAVITGRDARTQLVLSNQGSNEIVVRTNGQLTARILDPHSGEWVGGYAGAQTLPLIRFCAAPGEAVRIPLLVGTASYVPRLGYAVPAGHWEFDALLDLEDGTARTPSLPITIVGAETAEV